MSAHLEHIIDKQHGSTNATVVFLDIVKYSMRKSIKQQGVIQSFNEVLRQAIESVSAKHVTEFSQKRKLNLDEDIVKIPTGDGAAIVFPFEGLQNIHLDFSLDFLRHSLSSRKDEACDIFATNGWCNCHNFFDVRTGISDGKVIVYKDVNGNYNIAGGTINTASRVMNLADKQQIMFTLDAYKSIIDMTEDTTLEDRFVIHGKINVKHDVNIDVCQYIGHGENYISRDVPIQVEIYLKESSLIKSRPKLFGEINYPSPIDRLKRLEILEILKDMPIPEGILQMLGPVGQIPDKESAKAAVEALKVLDQLIGIGGIKEKIIEASKKGSPDDLFKIVR